MSSSTTKSEQVRMRDEMTQSHVTNDAVIENEAFAQFESTVNLTGDLFPYILSTCGYHCF